MPPHGTSRVLDGFRTVLAGADADSVLDPDDEDLAVAHLAAVFGPSRQRNLVDHSVDDLRLHHGLDLEPRPQRDVHRRAPIFLRVSALGAASLDLGHGDARHAALVQHVLDLLELFVTDYRDDHLHAGDPFARVVPPTGSGDRCGLTVGVSAGRETPPGTGLKDS